MANPVKGDDPATLIVRRRYDRLVNEPAPALLLALLAFFPGVGICQQRVKPVTVCEVLGNLSAYGNSVVAIVGRMDISASLIDHYEYVSQGHCDQPLHTQGLCLADQDSDFAVLGGRNAKAADRSA